MIEALSTVLIVVSLVAAAWAALLVVLGRVVLLGQRDGLALVGLLALLELGLVAQAVAGFVALAGANREVDGPSFGGYLVGVLVILPLAAAWALLEHSRWGPSVLIVGCLTVPVMIVRLQQIWGAHVS
ncbi:MAG: hypothetical protein GEV04_19045 [Actinophytocola sp.]|nr:hypothetical protein [Actinophytocola sp.]